MLVTDYSFVVFFFDIHFEDVSSKSFGLMFDPDFFTFYTIYLSKVCTYMHSNVKLPLPKKSSSKWQGCTSLVFADSCPGQLITYITLLVLLRVSRGHVHELAPVLRRLTLTCAYRMIIFLFRPHRDRMNYVSLTLHFRLVKEMSFVGFSALGWFILTHRSTSNGQQNLKSRPRGRKVCS